MRLGRHACARVAPMRHAQVPCPRWPTRQCPTAPHRYGGAVVQHRRAPAPVPHLRAGNRWRCPLQTPPCPGPCRQSAGGPTSAPCAPRQTAPVRAGTRRRQQARAGISCAAVAAPCCTCDQHAHQTSRTSTHSTCMQRRPCSLRASSAMSRKPCLSASARSAGMKPGGGVRKPPSPRIGSRMSAATSPGCTCCSSIHSRDWRRAARGSNGARRARRARVSWAGTDKAELQLLLRRRGCC